MATSSQRSFGVQILTAEEYRAKQKMNPEQGALLRSLDSIRYCKAEASQSGVQGVFRIPQKSPQRTAWLCFAFYLNADTLTLIENDGILRKEVQKLQNRLTEPVAPDQQLLLLLEQLMEHDILYLQHIEEELDTMEGTLLHRVPKGFYASLLRYRRKLSEFHSYYEQMGDICDSMQSDLCADTVKNREGWKSHAQRLDRLHRYVNLLREYAIQLRELYQSQQDARQNKTIGILTVVTTLFLPLTLLTGWYGMNFTYMPELRCQYGYPAVMLTAAAIVIFEIFYFKKKGLL